MESPPPCVSSSSESGPSTSSVLPTGQELFTLLHRDGNTLPRSYGQKEGTGSSSWLKKKQVTNLLNEHHELLKEPRCQRISELSQAEWDSDTRRAIVLKHKHKCFEHMGKTVDGHNLLHPFEALFLMEATILEVWHDKVPMSIQEAYNVMLDSDLSLERFQVYSHLTRAGYIVILHQGRLEISHYEKRIGLDRYLKKEKKAKKRRHSSSRNISNNEEIICLDGESHDGSVDDIDIIDEVPVKQSRSAHSSQNVEIILDQDSNDIQIVPAEDEPSTSSYVARKNVEKSEEISRSVKEEKHVDDCIFIVDAKPASKPLFLEFPKIMGKKVITIKSPPDELLPKNVYLSKSVYTLDLSKLTSPDNVQVVKFPRREWRKGSPSRSSGYRYNRGNNFRDRHSGRQQQNWKSQKPNDSNWYASEKRQHDQEDRYESRYQSPQPRNRYDHSLDPPYDPENPEMFPMQNCSFNSVYPPAPLFQNSGYQNNQIPSFTVPGLLPVTNPYMQNNWMPPPIPPIVPTYLTSYPPYVPSERPSQFNPAMQPPRIFSPSFYYGGSSGNQTYLPRAFDDLDFRYRPSKPDPCSQSLDYLSLEFNSRFNHNRGQSSFGRFSQLSLRGSVRSQEVQNQDNSFQDRRQYRPSQGRSRSPYSERSGTPTNDRYSDGYQKSRWSYSNRRSDNMRVQRQERRKQQPRVQESDECISVIPKLDVTTTNWTQFKEELAKKLNLETLASGTGSPLWRGEVRPLVMPSNDLTIAGIMSQLSVFEKVNLINDKKEVTSCNFSTSLQIDFDLYLPTTLYRKRMPTLPEHRVVVMRYSSDVPQLSDLVSLQSPLSDGVPLLFAVVDSGVITIHSLDGLVTPHFMPCL